MGDGAGDDREVEELVSRFRTKAKRITGFHGIPGHDADDLVQQTYLTFLNKRDEIRNPEAWLAGTLNQRCLMFWRSRRRSWLAMVEDCVLEAAGGRESPPQEMLALRRDLTLAIASLPVRWQKLLHLKFSLGLDSRETAECLGYRYSGIYTITKRCLAALAREMEARGWEGARVAQRRVPRG